MEMCLSSCLSYWLFITFLAEKQLLSQAKNFNSPRFYVENKSLRPSALPTKTSLNFPPGNSLPPRKCQSQTVLFTDGDFLIK